MRSCSTEKPTGSTGFPIASDLNAGAVSVVMASP
jgi:hypothetical protein